MWLQVGSRRWRATAMAAAHEAWAPKNMVGLPARLHASAHF